MKKLIFVLALSLSVSNVTFAETSFGNAVVLDDQSISTTTNIHGKCGNAFVNITAVNNEDYLFKNSLYLDGQDAVVTGENGRISPEAKIVVMENANKQKRTTITLSEHSLVRCLSTASGKKLLIGTVCLGNVASCEYPNYYLVDAEKISNPDTRNGCDAKCINKKLGKNYIKIK